jgi:predicted metal-dependent peptidase
MSVQSDRAGFEEAIANMSISSSPFFNDYVFYMHLVAQCRLVFDDTMQYAAAVNFVNNSYNLFICPSMFNKEPLEQRVGIIKHEMLHIALGHLFRYDKEDTNFQNFNYAADCALNQEIKREHLLNGIYPDNFPNPEANNHWGQTTEFYYNLLKNNKEDEDSDGDDDKDSDKESEGNGKNPSSGKGKGKSKRPDLTGDHDKWKETKGDEYVQQEITKNMLEKAGDNTTKSRGNLPSSYAQMLDNITRRKEVDWKKVVRNIVGNKKANVRKTLMRKDRRMPGANWIKGRTKDRIFELAVISDVSGSVSDSALTSLWGEIINICYMFNTPVQVVQVDTRPTPPEALNKNTKTIKRKANGGTFLSPAIETLREHKIVYNALVITTDGELCESDVVPFSKLKVPVIWLIEHTGRVMPSMNKGTMRAIKLTKHK